MMPIFSSFSKTMSELTINVNTREGEGRGPARRLRAQGLVPAVVYGKDGQANSITVVEKDFLLLMRNLNGQAKIVQLQQDGSTRNALIQDYQRNPRTDHFEHIDFMEVYEDRPLETKVPVNIVGEAYGVRTEKGVLNFMVRKLKVRCLPKDLPTHIDLDVTDVKKSEGLQIGKITPPEGCKILGRKDVVVIVITK